MSTRGREGGPVRFGHGELVLVALAGTHGADTCSGANEAVAVQWAMALASRTYGEDKPRERKVGEALVGAGHGRAQAQRCTTTMAAMVAAHVASPKLKWWR